MCCNVDSGNDRCTLRRYNEALEGSEAEAGRSSDVRPAHRAVAYSTRWLRMLPIRSERDRINSAMNAGSSARSTWRRVGDHFVGQPCTMNASGALASADFAAEAVVHEDSLKYRGIVF